MFRGVLRYTTDPFLSYLQEIDGLEPLLEMANPYDIVKKPLKLDAEEYDFLKQFDPAYWSAAYRARHHDDFANAVESRQAEREKWMPELIAKYKKVAENEPHMQELFKNLLTNPNYKNKPEKQAKKRAEYLEKRARLLAEKEAEEKIPLADKKFEEKRPYVFAIAGAGAKGEKKTKTIWAFPHINRLIHKIETTHDQPFHPDVANELKQFGMDRGEYGYDLGNFERKNKTDPLETGNAGKRLIPYTARGYKGSTREQIGDRLTDWLNHSAHEMYGKLPGKGEHSHAGLPVSWKPAKHGRQQLLDNYTLKKYRDKIIIDHKIKDTVCHDPHWSKQTTIKKNEEVLRRADEELLKMVKAGQVRTPRNPLNPEGAKVEITQDENGKDIIKRPDLHLPYHKVPVEEEDENGERVTKYVDVPAVHPSKYLRKFGYDEKADKNVPASARLGQEGEWVESPEYIQGSKYYSAAGALQPSRESSGRKYLDETDPRYQGAYQNIIGNMKTVRLDANAKKGAVEDSQGEFYEDFIKGIRNGIQSGFGGAGTKEREAAEILKTDFHQEAVARLMEDLGNDKMKTPEGRANMAKNIVGVWVQRNLGGRGPRRTRKATSDIAFELPEEGEGGLTKDIIQNQVRAAVASSMGSGQKRKQGQRRMITGVPGESYYDIRQLSKMMDDAAKQAAGVEQLRPDSAEEIEMMIKDKTEVLFRIQAILAANYVNSGMSEDEANAQVAKDTKQLAQGDQSISAIVKNFRKEFNHLSDQLGYIPQAGEGQMDREVLLPLEAQWERMEEDLLKDKEKLADPGVMSNVTQVFDDFVRRNPVFGPRWDDLKKRLGIGQQQQKPQTPAAAQIPGVSPGRSSMRERLAARKDAATGQTPAALAPATNPTAPIAAPASSPITTQPKKEKDYAGVVLHMNARSVMTDNLLSHSYKILNAKKISKEATPRDLEALEKAQSMMKERGLSFEQKSQPQQQSLQPQTQRSMF